jgi:2-haloacid dehalogenase
VSQLSLVQLNRSVEEAARHVMDGFGMLELHPDVASAVGRLNEDGVRLVTLSNGATSVADRLLTSAGIRDRFERLLSVEDAGAWKPSRLAYAYAATECGVDPADMVLVASHPWDVDGARRAGLQSAWVNRSEAPYPGTFLSPTYTVTSLDDLADQWS